MKNRKGNILMITGLLLLAAALCLTFYNLQDEWRAGREAAGALAQMSYDSGRQPDDAQSVPDYMLNQEMDMPTVTVDGIEYIGVLTMPTLDRSLPVISEWGNSKLKISPCRYSGSAYLGSLVIAGHNYRSHFGRLGRLSIGDEIIFTDVDGNDFHYQVADMELLEDTAVEDMGSGDWELTLFTCTWSGGDRVTVRCKECKTDN